jgi:hypothetical protein
MRLKHAEWAAISHTGSVAKHLGVWTLALAILFGLAGSSGAKPAQKTGKTGKTTKQCLEDQDACINDCYLIEIDGEDPATTEEKISECEEHCIDLLEACLPKRLSASAVGVIVAAQPLVLRGELGRLTTKLAQLRAKLGELQTQVGALQTGTATSARPDLVPRPRPASTGPEGFCRLSADLTHLQVEVVNQGTATADTSSTRVEFANNAPVDVKVAVPAGGSAVVEFAIPATCPDAQNNCHFAIGVDATNAVSESDETNNNAAGVCGASIQ